jgi:nucleoside-diphosphate-sugar epimerase
MPVASYKGEIYSLPFNMWSFNQLWGVKTPHEAKQIIEEQSSDVKYPPNLEECQAPDGTCIRDCIHVTDLAKAHVLALHALQSGSQSTSNNLGNGKGYSVSEVVSAAKQVTTGNFEVQVSPGRVGGPARLVGDASRAIIELGWKPEYHQLQTILESAWQWNEKLQLMAEIK